MITYRKGNLLDTPDRIIAHGCNAQRVMGKGVALDIRRKYPWAYDQYMRSTKDWLEFYEHMKFGPRDMLGNNFYASQDGSLYIVNMITQEDYRRDSGISSLRYVSYDAVDYCMCDLNRWMNDFHQTDVSMPKIGSGLGGGSWPVIENIIKYHLDDKNVTIWTL